MNIEPLSSQPKTTYDTTRLHPIVNNISLTRRITDLLLVNSKIPQPHLLSLALTCKAFSDPALDTLWESMNSLMPLLKLLSPLKLINGFYIFQGPFDEQNLQRFDAYSRRVKKLSVSQDCSNVAPATFIRLAQLRPLLLPALEELNSPSTFEHDTNILLLLSSSLKRLDIGGDEAIFHKLISPTLLMIAYESGKQENPSLTHLTLRGEPPSLAPGLLGRFSNIQHLNISKDIDIINLRVMGELPNLESANIILPDSCFFEDEELRFTKLRSLSIASSFPSLLLVFGKMVAPNVESISITAKPIIQSIFTEPPARTSSQRGRSSNYNGRSSFREQPPPRLEASNDWQGLVKSINARWSSTLKSLTLIQNNPPSVVINLTPSDLFSGLFSFQRLKELKIQKCDFFPCDEGIHLLASVCPNLTVLHLPLDCTAVSTPFKNNTEDITSRSKINTTIAALWSLCDLCTRLKELQIRLDVTDLPPFLNTTVRSHSLARLSIRSHKAIQEDQSKLLDIARHIDRLFPCLKTITCNPWSEVERIVIAYQMVRLDDNARW